jgi:hypothetical protein
MVQEAFPDKVYGFLPSEQARQITSAYFYEVYWAFMQTFLCFWLVIHFNGC